MNHTPTPYDYIPAKHESTQIFGRTESGGCWFVASATNNANAAFIVRACNAHDALVKALAEMVQVHLRPSGPSTGNIVNDKRREACEQAVMSALKLARGE